MNTNDCTALFTMCWICGQGRPITEGMTMCTWEEIGEKWSRAQQMGWQAIQAAMEVGEELTRKKYEVPYREFSRRAGEIGLNSQRSSELMRLALHRDLIEHDRRHTDAVQTIADDFAKALAELARRGGKQDA